MKSAMPKKSCTSATAGDADAFSLAQAEDIINRGGGNLIIELWNAGAHEETENTDVTVTIDGCRQTHMPGSQLRLTPGRASA